MKDEIQATAVPEPAAIVARLADGTVFAREFRVRGLLGRGGMGAVYVVEQLSTGRERALKLMDPNLVASGKNRERFLQEARAGSHIDSDHVVEVVDAGIDPDSGTPWLAMELLRGETLGARLASRGCLPPAEVAEIFRQLGHALRAAHAAGIVHRDIKPENVFLAEGRRSDVTFTVKVLDFGIAKLLSSAETSGHTTSGIGSPMWMSPEQAAAGHVSPATDVWPLGLIAYFLLTGSYYWRAGNREDAAVTALLTEILVDTIEPASVRAASQNVAVRLPAGFDPWFARCVSRDPQGRFPEAGAAVDALLGVLGAAAGTAAASPVARTPTVPLPRPALDTGTPAATAALAATLPSGAQDASGRLVHPGRRGKGTTVAIGLLLLVVVTLVVTLVVMRRSRAERRRTVARSPVTAPAEFPIPAPPSVPPHVPSPAPPAPPPAVPPAPVPASGADVGAAVADGAAAVDAAAAAEAGPAAPVVAPPASPAAEHGLSPRPAGRMTVAARNFLNAVVLPCWRDVQATEPQPPTRIRVTVPYGPEGRPSNVTIADVPFDGAFVTFRRCVVQRGTERFRFEPLPEEAEVVIRTTLPEAP